MNDPDYRHRYRLTNDLTRLRELVPNIKAILDFVSNEDTPRNAMQNYEIGVIKTKLDAGNRKAWMKEQKSLERANEYWQHNQPRYWKERTDQRS